jgi:hypothetical protein
VLAGMNNNAGTTADSTNVYVMKVDSLGGAGTCSGITTTDLTVVSPSFTTSAITATIGDVTITNPVITVNPVSLNPEVNTLCFYCYNKPTGSQRVAGNDVEQHTLKIYPNPTSSDPINVLIDAKYDDDVTLSIVDVYGNVLYVQSPRPITTGRNLIQLNIVSRLRNYSNYFIIAKYKNYSDAVKIFIVK